MVVMMMICITVIVTKMTVMMIFPSQPRQCSVLIERGSRDNTKTISVTKLNFPGN